MCNVIESGVCPIDEFRSSTASMYKSLTAKTSEMFSPEPFADSIIAAAA